MSELFIRNVPHITQILAASCVGIAGCGGIGSNAAVSLVRAGVGSLILADCDLIEASNLNRQQFFQDDIGQSKVQTLRDLLLKINPDVRIEAHHIKLTPQTAPQIFAQADALIEAFDRAEAKHWLIQSWCRKFPNRLIAVGSGLSGLGPTEDLRIARSANLVVCGDQYSDMSQGLCATRVAIVANMQTHEVIRWLLTNRHSQPM
jgi:sulfur carrier protein ThiS adenylyltransferase